MGSIIFCPTEKEQPNTRFAETQMNDDGNVMSSLNLIYIFKRWGQKSMENFAR